MIFLCGLGIDFQRVDISSWITGFISLTLGFFINGVLGGISLGLAQKGDWKKTITLALFGGIGFLIGGLLPVILQMVFLRFPIGWYHTILFGRSIINGAILGAAIGITSRDIMKIIFLALAGVFGFIIGSWSTSYLYYWFDFKFSLIIIQFVLQGAIIGAVLGATLGYLDRK